MNAHEHRAQAEKLLEGDAVWQLPSAEAVEAAKAHALLALVDYVREIGDQLDSIPRRRPAQQSDDEPLPADLDAVNLGWTV